MQGRDENLFRFEMIEQIRRMARRDDLKVGVALEDRSKLFDQLMLRRWMQGFVDVVEQEKTRARLDVKGREQADNKQGSFAREGCGNVTSACEIEKELLTPVRAFDVALDGIAIDDDLLRFASNNLCATRANALESRDDFACGFGDGLEGFWCASGDVGEHGSEAFTVRLEARHGFVAVRRGGKSFDVEAEFGC